MICHYGSFLIKQSGLVRFWVVDLDVHQEMEPPKFFEANPQVYFQHAWGPTTTLAIKESDLDVPCRKDRDSTYLNLLQSSPAELMDKFEPDFIIYPSRSGSCWQQINWVGLGIGVFRACRKGTDSFLETARRHRVLSHFVLHGGRFKCQKNKRIS